jgi:hypothetical protein
MDITKPEGWTVFAMFLVAAFMPSRPFLNETKKVMCF